MISRIDTQVNAKRNRITRIIVLEIKIKSLKREKVNNSGTKLPW